MKKIVVIVGWTASLCAALVGIVLVCVALSEFYFLPAGLTCIAFAIAVNPLAIRKLTLLHKPWVVTGIAVGAVILGVVSLTGATGHMDAIAAREAGIAKVAAQKAAVAREAADLKAAVMAEYPMSEADYERFRIVATSDIDVNNAASLRKYFKAQYELENPSDDADLIEWRVRQQVGAIATIPALKAAVKSIGSADHSIRAEAFLRELKDKGAFEKRVREKIKEMSKE